jgi:CubicO group peptidase (beta-lactamase class C family)
MGDKRTDEIVFPGTEWNSAAPEDHGLDVEKIKRAADDIFEIENRYGFLLVKDGLILFERYLRDAAATNHIFSVTKGLGATLVGIAQQKGMLRVNDLVSDWLPVHHPDIAEGAEIRHVLNMTASRTPVGSWWQYNSAEILNSIPGILWLASGVTPHQFYTEQLREPLGLDFDWPCNDRGWIQIGSRGPLPVIEATHRDMARVGHLWLNRGMWRGEQIVDPRFIDAALRPPYPDANGAYGYLWWLNSDEGTWRTTGGNSASDSRWFPYAPTNVFLALGARGKVMIVVPDHNVIVVSMGDTPQEQSANYLDKIMRAVFSFLPE